MEKTRNHSRRVMIDDLFLSLLIWTVFIIRRDLNDLLIVREIFHPTCIFALIPHALIAYAILYCGIRIGLIGTPKAVFITRRIPHFAILVATIVLCWVFWKPIGYVQEILHFRINRDNFQQYADDPVTMTEYKLAWIGDEQERFLRIRSRNWYSYCYFPDMNSTEETVLREGNYPLILDREMAEGWYICYYGST